MPKSRLTRAKGKSPSPLRTQLVTSLFLVATGLAGAMALSRSRKPDATGVARSLVKPAAAEQSTDRDYIPRLSGTLNYCQDIAPILWRRCEPCHRPGQAAPFNLQTYSETKRRSQQIAEATAKRLMPPWPPDSEPGELANDRRLTAKELGILQQWIKEGSREGDRVNLPPAPPWQEGWALGVPDLVVSMDTPYPLAAEGRDVYRNFVVPLPTTERRYVRGWEFRPSNAGVVDHAFLYLERTRLSRRRAAGELLPGFAAVGQPDRTSMPEGEFMTYQPGKVPEVLPDGSAWVLEKSSDLVLQVHMRPNGTPENLQAFVGFYFTDRPGTNHTVKILLTSMSINIPAGETNYVVTDSFTVPVGASVTALLPHSHYLAREIQATARFPDGSRRTLLLIKNWDFRWQGDYRFRKPVPFPAGTELTMRYRYDNSTNNLQNPNFPPKPISNGNQATDEMAELWIQLTVANSADQEELLKAFQVKTQKVLANRCEDLLRKDPSNAKDLVTLGSLLNAQGRLKEALPRFLKAISLDPSYELGHFNLDVLFLESGQLERAQALNPEGSIARASLDKVREALSQQQIPPPE